MLILKLEVWRKVGGMASPMSVQFQANKLLPVKFSAPINLSVCILP